MCRPCTLISIWTFVSCVRGLLSPASLNMQQEQSSEGSCCYSVYLHKMTNNKSITNPDVIFVKYMYYIIGHSCHLCFMIPHLATWISEIGYLLLPTELQIIFESNAYLPPNFGLHFKFQGYYFHPLYFFAMLKSKVLLFQSAVSAVLVLFLNIALVVICYCLWYCMYSDDSLIWAPIVRKSR